MKRKVLLLFALVFMAFSGNSQVTSVALVGEAAGGWPGDPGNPGPTDVHQMTSTDGENWTLVDVALTDATVGGGVKFRANNSWDINWGSASFPSGTGTQGGANIPTIAGVYTVTFNSTTGAYMFSGGAPIPTVMIVGAATGGTDITMSPVTAESFIANNVTLVDGLAQFSVDGSNFGGDTFPTGIGTDPGLFIPVAAGTYTSVTYNIATGDYVFTAAPLIPSIAIVGAATEFGWPTGAVGEVDAGVLTSTDGITYTGDFRLTATAPNNGLKFRQENSWTNSWGGTSFPTGPIAGDNGDIIVTAPGYYSVTFNRTTGEYSFAFPTIAIVGAGVGGWPGDPGNPGPTDVNQLTTTDGENYSITGLVAVGGEAKFRQNNAWTTAWGSTAFPSGIADVTPGSPNIPVPAGTYDVTFNRATGAYNFAALATSTFNKSNFKVYPNPTANNWNFNGVQNIETIQVIDVLGKIVLTVSPKSKNAIIDASALNAGVYFAKIGTASATQTVKLVKN